MYMYTMHEHKLWGIKMWTNLEWRWQLNLCLLGSFTKSLDGHVVLGDVNALLWIEHKETKSTWTKMNEYIGALWSPVMGVIQNYIILTCMNLLTQAFLQFLHKPSTPEPPNFESKFHYIQVQILLPSDRYKHKRVFCQEVKNAATQITLVYQHRTCIPGRWHIWNQQLTYLLLELGHEMPQQDVVEVFTTQEGISVGGLDL